MPAPGEYKIVQSRVLAYAQEIGWTYVPREKVERRRDFDPDAVKSLATNAASKLSRLLRAQER